MIPISEFVQLEAEARKAFKRADWATIARINNRLAILHTSIYWIGKDAYLTIHNPKDILKPEGDTP